MSVEVPDCFDRSKGDVRLTSEIGLFQYLVTLSEHDIKFIFLSLSLRSAFKARYLVSYVYY